MTPRQFLDLLWQYKPEELYVLIWTLPDKHSYWFRDVKAAAEFVLKARGVDLYIGVGLAAKDYGPHHRCVSEDISGIVGLTSDLDLISPAHQKALPGTIPEALSVLPAALEPTVVIDTGNGCHAWWLTREPYIFGSEEDRRMVAGISLRWHTMLRHDFARKGWAYDRLSDLARILRIPGTQNLKNPLAPKPVRVHSFSGKFYNISDFRDYLDDMNIPDAEAEEKAARQWMERLQGRPLVIEYGAKMPQEVLDGWLRADMRFRNTWNRQRHDLKDQSQSGYDLALACFGLDAGLSEQQIVDLIVHHRRVHSQKRRNRIDYFARTIAKAESRSDGVDPFKGASLLLPAGTTVIDADPAAPGVGAAPEVHVAVQDQTAADDVTQAPVPPPVPAMAPAANQIVNGNGAGARGPQPGAAPQPDRGTMLARISHALGVHVAVITKITGKEPTYQMELEGGVRLEFPSFAKFIDQGYVRNTIGAVTNRLVPKIKGKVWEEIVQIMLAALVEKEGGEETDFLGSATLQVVNYLSQTDFIESPVAEAPQFARRPTLMNGQIAICASDLQLHINKTSGEAKSVKAVASMLHAVGAQNARVRGSKFRDQSRWLLPAAMFPPEEFSGARKDEAGPEGGAQQDA